MDRRNIKALFFDVDGTLAGYQTHQIDPRDVESLQRMKEQGILLFIATGRDIRIPREAKVTEPIMPLMTGVVNANGQDCYLNDGTVISFHPIDEEDFIPIRRICEENHIAVLYYLGNNSYITELTDHVTAFSAHIGIPHPLVRPMEADLPAPKKVCLHISPEDEAKLITPVMKHTYSTRNTVHLIDLIPNGIGKDSGIREVCRYFGISPEETIAFGDGENDIDMLRTAGIGVAMRNADDRVKTAADYVTGTSEEAGITMALKHFGLLK